MEIEKILQELYLLDPSLKQHEAQLITLVSQMSELKPDTKFDLAFANRLKKEILKNSSTFKINLNFMNKKIYLTAGSVAVLGLIVLFFVVDWRVSNVGPMNNLQTEQPKVTSLKTERSIVKLARGAYGSLASAVGASNVSGESARVQAVAGMGGGREIMAVAADSASGVTSSMTVSSPSFVDAKMIAPMRNFKYVYKGDALDLTVDSGSVYRRLKGDGYLASNLTSLISNQDLGILNLQSFSNLKMTNLSLTEDRELGLMVNLDFNEDTIYIFENWEKWRSPERDACTDDTCFNRFRLKISEVPSDTDLITMSDNFLSRYNINLDNYGTAQVDNSWRAGYEISTDINNYYIPEIATIVYPLKIDDALVRDQSGNYYGLRVNVNISKKAASGLSGLSPYRYEASDYALETTDSRLMKVLENGGWNRFYYYGLESSNPTEVELGTPTKSLVQMWRYTNNKSEELLVPALIFPVLNAPSDYYGQKFVSIPLVSELVDELLVEPNQGGGGIGIMPMTVEGSAPASGPMVR